VGTVSAAVTALRLDHVSKLFGSVRAVVDVSLEVARGEIFTLLGPSACGKTTILRLVAGLERPDAGEITLRDRLVASVARRTFVAPHRRNLGMVAQSHAIWPHMTVFEHVAYPLELRGVRRATVRERVTAVLEMVGLAGLETRPATMLSGGQMQRLALCRALVYEPDLLLLDEPFSSLDAKLREQMRVEVKLLQRRLGVTVLFVTHDQLEALSLSDRRLLARTDLPGRGWLEFAFWAAFFLPTLTVTLSWILLLDPEYGLINVALARVLGRGPFDIYSFWGIVWVHVVTGSLTVKVILLTPAFRNMNAAFEEASYVAGGTTLRTALRITVPLMAPAILSVLLLGTMVSMQTFEVEQVLGLPFRFFVFSTSMMRGRSTTGRTC